MIRPEQLMAEARFAKLDKASQELITAFAENLQMEKRGAGGYDSPALRQFIEKASPTLADVHVSTNLTNLSIAYIQERSQFLAGGTGVMGVDREAGFYTEYDRGDFFRIDPNDARRTVGNESAGGGFKIKQTSAYQVKTYSWHKDVDEFLMAQQSTGDPIDDAVKYVTQILLLLREIEWSAAIMTLGVWGTDLTGVAGAPAGGQFQQWNEGGSVPRADLSGECVNIHSKTGFWPNIFALNPFVLKDLLLNAEITEAFKYTTAGATPTLDALAASLMVGAISGAATPRMVIAGAVETTSAEGAADTFDYVTGKEAILAYVDPSPALHSPTAWINFAWTGLLGSNAFGFRMKDLSDEFKGIPHRIEGDASFQVKPVAPELATFFTTAVA